MLVGAGFSALNPSLLFGLVDVLLYLLVEEGEPGSVGEWARMVSRSRMRSLAESERLGIMFGMLPLGTNCLVASRRMRLNVPSPVLQEVGGSKAAKRSSV